MLNDLIYRSLAGSKTPTLKIEGHRKFLRWGITARTSPANRASKLKSPPLVATSSVKPTSCGPQLT